MQPDQPHTILITGVAGFIGSHLAAMLLERSPSVQVIGIDNFDPFYARSMKDANTTHIRSVDPMRFHLLEGDIREEATVGRAFTDARTPIRAVIHLAALAGVRPSLRDPQRYHDVNVNGTRVVLSAAAEYCPEAAFVFGSSSSVYGNRPGDDGAFREDDPPNEPFSPYAATKQAGEQLCAGVAAERELRAALLRFFTVFGPRQRPDLAIAKFMRLIGANQPIEMFGDGTSARDYTFVSDICRGVIAAADHTAQQPDGFCRVYNLGGSQPVLLRDLIASIEEVTGRAAHTDQQPMQPGDVVRTHADTARAEAELGWSSTTDLAAGLEAQWKAAEGSSSGSDTSSPNRSQQRCE